MAKKFLSKLATISLFGIISLGMTPSFASMDKRDINPQTTIKLVYEDGTEDLEEHVEFLKDSIEAINDRYSKKYELSKLIVDSENGGVLIQKLIKPETVSPIIDNLNLNGLKIEDKVTKIMDYIWDTYKFIPDPFIWPSVETTISVEQGDCNSLSLLLMSLLLSAGVDKEHVYLGFSYHHMWVEVFYNGEWHTVETDKDPKRRTVYSTPGFYEHPLYKAFSDHTLKRIKNNSFKPN